MLHAIRAMCRLTLRHHGSFIEERAPKVLCIDARYLTYERHIYIFTTERTLNIKEEL